MVGRTGPDVLHLMQDGMIAARHALAAVAKDRAVAASLARLLERHAKDRDPYPEGGVQPADVDGVVLRHENFLWVNVGTHQPRNDIARECVHLLEFP